LKKYCTVADVLSVAIGFVDDVWPEQGSPPAGIVSHRNNTKTIPAEDVEYIISEASELVRARIQPEYDPDIIDGYESEGYPPVVIYMTKTLSTILMLQRYRPQSVTQNKELIQELQTTMDIYDKIIANGALRRQGGDLVPRIRAIEVQLGRDNPEFSAFDNLKDIYEDGRIY